MTIKNEVSTIDVQWPNGRKSSCTKGDDWLRAAELAGIQIPTGCLGGSCGACEIEVNGQVIRACISSIPETSAAVLKVEFATDPYW